MSAHRYLMIPSAYFARACLGWSVFVLCCCGGCTGANPFRSTNNSAPPASATTSSAPVKPASGATQLTSSAHQNQTNSPTVLLTSGQGEPTPVALPAHLEQASSESPTVELKNSLAIDLPAALRLANAKNPTIALAEARVGQAYAALRAAEVAYLPDLQTGPQYLRHDGQIQATTGQIQTVSRQSFFAHGDVGLSWDTSSLLYSRLIAERLAVAQEAQRDTIDNGVQLEVCLAYLDLLRFHAQFAIGSEALQHAEDMLKHAEAAALAGLGKSAADVNRARTEVDLRRPQLFNLQAQMAITSARLAQLLRLKPTVDLLPADETVIPLALVPETLSDEALVSMGMSRRPEIRQAQALIGAADARWSEAQAAPWLPRLDVGYTAGSFGGGPNNELNNFGPRSDGWAQATWVLHNFGAGDAARIQSEHYRYCEANCRAVEIETQLGAEISSAAKEIKFRRLSLASSQEAVLQAQETWRRLWEATVGLAGAQYDPLQLLIALRDLNQARTNYLEEVIEFNRAQFRLYWALGQPPMCSLNTATSLPTSVSLPTQPYSSTSQTH